MLVAANLHASLLTPPCGWALSFPKGVATPRVTTGDIDSGVPPLIGRWILELARLFFCFGRAAWLPEAIG